MKIWQQICLFWFASRRRLVSCAWRRTHNKNMSQFFKNFRWRRALSSKVFHWFHVAKCYSEVKNEELSWKKFTSKLFGKLSYPRWWQEENTRRLLFSITGIDDQGQSNTVSERMMKVAIISVLEPFLLSGTPKVKSPSPLKNDVAKLAKSFAILWCVPKLEWHKERKRIFLVLKMVGRYFFVI